MKELRFMVAGSPIPQGSKSARVYNGRAIMFEANKKLPAWRLAVSEAARLAMHDTEQIEPFSGPVRLTVTFFMQRPKKPKHDTYPGSKPDCDKLIRAICDSLTMAKTWADDALAVEIHARKLWCGSSTDSYPTPGCSVQITEL
jgi:crossover junction endodeoxyribonuclease RusA